MLMEVLYLKYLTEVFFSRFGELVMNELNPVIDNYEACFFSIDIPDWLFQ